MYNTYTYYIVRNTFINPKYLNKYGFKCRKQETTEAR